MKNLLKIIILMIFLYPYSNPKADETQPSFLRAMGGNAVVFLHWSPPAKDVDGYWKRETGSGNGNSVLTRGVVF